MMPLHLDGVFAIRIYVEKSLRKFQFVDHQNLILILDDYVGLIQLLGTAN